MKSFISIVLLVLLSEYGYSQRSHLLTMADLKRLSQCTDQSYFGSTVNGWFFTFKGTKKGKLNKEDGTQHRYVRTYPNPLFAEATASYWVMDDDTRRVVFTSDNKTWIAGLKADIERSGFQLVDQKNETWRYTLKEGNTTWYLTRTEPFINIDVPIPTLTLYSRTTNTQQPARPVAVQPTQPAIHESPAIDAPHLGGDWDKNYPQQNVANLFRAERQYAADQERKRGITGNTFTRAEKFRIPARYLGQYRPLTTDRWHDTHAMPLYNVGIHLKPFDLFKQEVLMETNEGQLWIPIQEQLISSLRKEARIGTTVTLYAMFTSNHDFKGTLHLSFVINEFAVPKEQQTVSVVPEQKPTIQEVAEPEKATLPVATNGTSECGFSWVPWSSVSFMEKEAMKKVMVDASPMISLFEYSLNALRDGHKIQIARYDFFNDNEPGYVVYLEYNEPISGLIGQIEIYEGLGEYHLFSPHNVTNDLCAFRSSTTGQRGLMLEDGRLKAFSVCSFFKERYASFLTSTAQTTPVAAAPKSNQPEDFKAFVKQFSTDNDFQMSRIKFPFNTTVHIDDEKPKVTLTQSSRWKHIDYRKPSRLSDGNKGVGDWTFHEDSDKNKNTESLGTCGCQECACGYFMSHHFQRIGGKWFLVREEFVSN